MDVKTAFFNENLTEEVYMTQPEGFISGSVAIKYENFIDPFMG